MVCGCPPLVMGFWIDEWAGMMCGRIIQAVQDNAVKTWHILCGKGGADLIQDTGRGPVSKLI